MTRIDARRLTLIAATVVLVAAGASAAHADGIFCDEAAASCPCWTPEELRAAMVDGCNDVLANACNDTECFIECTDSLFLGAVRNDGDSGYCDAFTDGGLISFELPPAQAEACRATIESLPIARIEPPLG